MEAILVAAVTWQIGLVWAGGIGFFFVWPLVDHMKHRKRLPRSPFIAAVTEDHQKRREAKLLSPPEEWIAEAERLFNEQHKD